MQASASSSLTVERLVAARRLIGRDVFSGIALLFRKTVGLGGLLLLAAIAFLAARPDVRVALLEAGNTVSYALFGPRDGAVDAAVASDAVANDPVDVADLPAGPLQPVAYDALPKDQRSATAYLSRKYRLAPDAIAALVSESYRVGADNKLDPLLILAVASIESNFNPFAQSVNGAQGLMQVMTPIHADRFDDYGGAQAALNPFANIHVGAAILKEMIVRNGSVEAGLKAYVGSALHPDDGGYGARVLGERARLELAVMKGATLLDPMSAPRPVTKTIQAQGHDDAVVAPASTDLRSEPASHDDAQPTLIEAPVKTAEPPKAEPSITAAATTT